MSTAQKAAMVIGITGGIGGEIARSLLEMRYLWQAPLGLDNRKLLATLGSEPHTPLDVAVRATLQALGCVREEPIINTAHEPARGVP